PEEAAGAWGGGPPAQPGTEMEESATGTLRNTLRGRPRALPAINMARARDVGIPPLNQVRRDIFAQTNDGQLAPYTSWSDFGQHMKHPESLVNFVAAYGTHPSIVNATTLADKRSAAKAIVDPQPPDPLAPPPAPPAFMFSTAARP